jgi:hypothetical protein
MIPVLWGPNARHFVIDHHHLARALWDEGVEDVLVDVVADLHALKRDEFWTLIDNHGWCDPYDDEGVRRGFDAIPNSIGKLTDDPYRSVAGELRRMGGYAKEPTPFSEFMWADFMRRRVKRRIVEDNLARAMERALSLAKSREAAHLPGWSHGRRLSAGGSEFPTQISALSLRCHVAAPCHTRAGATLHFRRRRLERPTHHPRPVRDGNGGARDEPWTPPALSAAVPTF